MGKRLAFDPGKGRLWAVCPGCRRWNLAPIETRWEAVEDAERLFRGQRLRAKTDNIGLTKLKEGTELVRIGPALRPEFAAWRYGRIFGQRLRRNAAMIGGGSALLAAGAAVGGAPLLSTLAALPPVWLIALHLMVPFLGVHRRLKSTKVIGNDDKMLRVFRADLDHTELLAGEEEDPWRLRLRHSYGTQELGGERARRALGVILARVNRAGAAAGTVRDATGIIADAGDPERVPAIVAKVARQRAGDFAEEYRAYQRGEWLKNPFRPDAISKKDWTRGQEPTNRGALPKLPRELRLALEMALHEDTEQAALEGELALLAAAWREAEEIAAIADNLLTPIPARLPKP
ncbi:MAG: hypothetical protein WD801_01235 [Gemmatimonadaceae bacterium]